VGILKRLKTKTIISRFNDCGNCSNKKNNSPSETLSMRWKIKPNKTVKVRSVRWVHSFLSTVGFPDM
jgi:hypothetical protein